MTRILIVSSELPPGPGGIGTHAYELATALSNDGADIQLLGCQHYADSSEVRVFNTRSPVPIVTLPDGGDPIRTAVARARTIRVGLREFRPDIVLASGGRILWLCAALCPRAKVPWVAVVHGTELGGSASSALLTRLSLEHADGIIAVSKFTRGLVEAAGVAARRPIDVVTNGADPDRFSVDADSGDRFRELWGLGRRPVILTVGNVTERKGQQVIVRALPALVATWPDLRYVVVGRPTEAQALQRLASELGVAQHLVITGQVAPEQLLGAYNAADLFTMTSTNTGRGDVEGFGIAVVEAALCGKPAVVSRGTGAEEAVDPEETGLVADPSRPGEVAEAIARMLESPEIRERMGNQARQRTLNGGSWAAKTEAYTAVLNEVLDRQRTRRGRMVVVSHTPHHEGREGVVGFGPTLRELDELASLFVELVHVAPLYPGAPPGDALPYRSPHVRYVPVRSTGGGTVGQRLSALRAVPEWVRSINKELNSADVVHVRCPAGIAMVALGVLTFRRSPAKRWFKYAGNWHPTGPEPGPYRLQRWWLRHHLARGEVTVNGDWANQPRWVHAFDNPTLTEEEIDRGREAATSKPPPPPFRLAFVGRVEKAKGIDVVVDTVRVLAAEGVDVELEVIGDGPIREQLADTCEATGIADQVRFAGWVTRAMVEEVLAVSHCLVLPSASEGFPKVLAEAMAFGAVPVATRVSSIGQVLDDLGLQTSLPAATEADLTGLVRRLVLDPAMIDEFRSRGLEGVRRFSYAEYLERVRSLLNLDPSGP